MKLLISSDSGKVCQRSNNVILFTVVVTMDFSVKWHHWTNYWYSFKAVDLLQPSCFNNSQMLHLCAT